MYYVSQWWGCLNELERDITYNIFTFYSLGEFAILRTFYDAYWVIRGYAANDPRVLCYIDMYHLTPETIIDALGLEVDILVMDIDFWAAVQHFIVFENGGSPDPNTCYLRPDYNP